MPASHLRLFIALGLVSLVFALSDSVHAQNATVVSTCGTPPSTYTAGTVRPITQDVNGNQCNTGGTTPSGGGITPVVAGSAASSAVLKAAPGNLFGAYVTTGATQGWLMIFNATSLPANGATTAGTASGNMVECLYAPANATTNISFNPSPPEVYSVGITAAFSSTGCGTLTASATAFLHGSVQ